MTVPKSSLQPALTALMLKSASKYLQQLSRVLLSLCLLLGVRPALCQMPLERFWVPDGPVYAILETNDVVYIGGDFCYVRPATGGGVVFDTKSGVVGPQFPKIHGGVLVAVSDGRGGWYVGGDFTSVGGIARTNLAHIKAGNAVDLNWRANADGSVQALFLLGDTLYVGGYFSEIGAQRRPALAAVDANTVQVRLWSQAIETTDKFS